MNAHAVACTIYESDGTPLASGTALVQQEAVTREVVISAMDRPGTVVQRLMLGGVREVRLRLAGDGPLAARVERVSFDSRLGRTCTLRF